MLLLPDEGHFRGRIAWVTFALIGANFVCFAIQIIGGDPIHYGYSLTAAKVTSGQDVPSDKLIKTRVPVSLTVNGQVQTQYTEVWVKVPHHRGPVPIHLTLLTSMFMHGGWIHLLGNMWFLWIFGSLVEKMLPRVLFLVYYLACGLGAAVAHLCVDPEAVVPYVGASGAISGLMGAYLWLLPLSKLRVWIVLVFEVPALVALPVWLVLQISSGLAVITSEEVHGGVAYWAHVGGFATGWVFLISLVVWLKAVTRRKPPAPKEEPEGYVTLSTAKYLNRPLPTDQAGADR